MVEKILHRIFIFCADLIETAVIAMAIFVIVYFFLVQPHQVYGNSMVPTLQNGDYILTNKISYRFHLPQRGDIVVFKTHANPARDFIKRIIGLPGEKILVKNGKVFVNGKQLQESYLAPNTPTFSGSLLKEGKEFIIPPKKYFVLGDNRINSSDSRDFGPISQEDIIGKAWLRYWPIWRFSFIPSVIYR